MAGPTWLDQSREVCAVDMCAGNYRHEAKGGGKAMSRHKDFIKEQMPPREAYSLSELILRSKRRKSALFALEI